LKLKAERDERSNKFQRWTGKDNTWQETRTNHPGFLLNNRGITALPGVWSWLLGPQVRSIPSLYPENALNESNRPFSRMKK
jgi:hypothetical protein